MFYSHEILTSRESGVATVWLVATLGSKSNLKRINRKAILDVDVPRTCGVIVNPEAPMALRLQSNLLYGVSRVYLSQCGYILSDAQSIQSNMKTMLKVVRTAELDPDAGKARPDQLVLPDDPAFFPDINFPGIDLAALSISTDESSRRSSILSLPIQPSSRSSQRSSDESAIGLIIPSSDIGGAGDLGGIALPSSERGSIQRSAVVGRLFEEEDTFEVDPGFTIDVDGNLILTGEEEPLPRETAGPTIGPQTIAEPTASTGAFQESESVLQHPRFESEEEVGLGPDLPHYGEAMVLPEAEPFPPMVPQGPPDTGYLPGEESSSSTKAPIRQRRRIRRELPVDETQELRNIHLAQWNNGYLLNMQEAYQQKQQYKAASLAKKNAFHWVFGAGIGGIGALGNQSKLYNPLDIFAGGALMEALLGTQEVVAGKKRSRSREDQRSSSEERRVRMREDDGEQIGRGNGLTLRDDEIEVPGSEAIETGRHAVEGLDEYSQMPWNRSALARDSRQSSITRGYGFPGSAGGFPISGERQSSLPSMGRPGPFDRRASRITSASPLVGRGAQEREEIQVPRSHDDDLEGLPPSIGGDEFQVYGPATGVSTQTAAQSQWTRAALDAESNNFLEYLKTEMSIKAVAQDKEEDELAGGLIAAESVIFEELLPPANNSKVVAAQALHHVLVLATKGLIDVQQKEHYGPIEIRVSS